MIIIIFALIVALFTVVVLVFKVLALSIKKDLERNQAVYYFRLWVLNKYPEHYDKLPSYEEMFNDNKKISLESYNKIIYTNSEK